MDEDQFRATYHTLNPRRCVFEKAINNQRCHCTGARQFLIATREGVACEAPEGPQCCETLLDNLRKASRFALKSVYVDGPLPHNRELQVQAGGILGLQKRLQECLTVASEHVVEKEASEPGIPDEQLRGETPEIYSILQQALKHWQTSEQIPYADLVSDIAHYAVRPKRRPKP